MDQQNNSSDSQVNFQSPSNDTPRRSFRMKKSTVIGVLALLILVAAVPLTVKIAQQRQNLKQRAATEGVTCGRCSNTNLGKWATFQTNDACPGGVSASAAPIPGTQITYTDKAECSEGAAAYCIYDPWKGVADWMKGNGNLGSDQLRYAPGDPEWDEKKDWIKPGPVLPKGTPFGKYIYNKDGSVKQSILLGGAYPVAYDPSKDTRRFEYNGIPNGESAWSRFVRHMDDAYFGPYAAEIASRQISTGVVMKYELIRIARDAIHARTGGYSNPQEANDKIINFEDTRSGEAQQIANEVGFDVTSLIQNKELRKWVAGNDAQRKANMIADSSSCTNTPNPVPTSSTPVSCEDKLLVPPSTYAVNIPSFTSKTCTLQRNESGVSELDACGDYWISAYCNSNSNAVMACRGWNQSGTNTLLMYLPKRIFAITSQDNAQTTGAQLASNIAQYGDRIGRRKTWNYLMTEIKQGKIAFPYGYKDVDGALNAAATAIFDKTWGQVQEQERVNNCSTTWDGPTTPTNPSPSTPSTSPSGPATGTGTPLDITAIFHGIGAGGDNANTSGDTSNQDPKRRIRDAKVIISDENDTESSRKEVSMQLTYDVTAKKYRGGVDVSSLNLTAGSYTIKLKVDQYLVRRFGASSIRITPGQTNVLPQVQLVAGNANNDTVLSVLDYNMLRDCVSVLQPARACNDAAKKLATDFNDDDKVDNVDYTLFVRELSVQNGD